MTGKWIVHTKPQQIAPGQSSFEICVIREDYEHGLRSYGWFDERKLLISHSGGPCRNSLTPEVLGKLLTVAEQVAAELNTRPG